MTPERQPPSEESLLDSTTMRLREQYITDRMMESYFVIFHTKKHKRYSRKLTVVCAELTNPDLSSETSFEELATISQR